MHRGCAYYSVGFGHGSGGRQRSLDFRDLLGDWEILCWKSCWIHWSQCSSFYREGGICWPLQFDAAPNRTEAV
jgi:hypothetical protein